MWRDKGGMSFADANDMNVPVNIFLTERNGVWTLSASNFMPRKGTVTDTAYCASSHSRAELVALVERYVKPLYEAAMANVNAICESTEGELQAYFWEKKT